LNTCKLRSFIKLGPSEIWSLTVKRRKNKEKCRGLNDHRRNGKAASALVGGIDIESLKIDCLRFVV
jgi:hypothetical protein